MSDSLQPNGLQHGRLPCPSTSPRACSNSYPSSQWCHPTIFSSVFPFSSCLQSFPLSRVFTNELALHVRWSKWWSFSFSISPSKEYSGLISSLLLNILSRFVIASLPQSKHLLNLWLQSPSAVIWEPKKIVFHCSHCFPIYLLWSDETGCHDLSFFKCWILSQFFSLFFTFINTVFSSLCFLP